MVAFTRPTSRLVTAEQPWANEARFAYTASVPRSPVYPDGSVSTGEPVFLRLVPRLRVDVGVQARDARAGSRRRDDRHDCAALRRAGLGRACCQVTPEQEFSGAVARIDGVVDLTRVQRLTEQLQELTGTSQAAYSLTLATRVTTTGEVDGRPLESTFSPSIALELADLRLQPQLDDDGSFVRRETGLGEVSVRESIRVGRAQLPVRQREVDRVDRACRLAARRRVPGLPARPPGPARRARTASASGTAACSSTSGSTPSTRVGCTTFPTWTRSPASRTTTDG